MSGLVVVDHTEPTWAARYRRAYVSHGRENGAAAYSREIVKHHIPVWERFAGEGTVIATCPSLARLDVSGRVGVQYVHWFGPRALRQVGEVLDMAGPRFEHLLFVTAHRSLAVILRRAGIDAIWVPMAVDVSRVQAAIDPAVERYEGPRAIYYGNLTSAKRAEFAELAAAFRAAGWQLDVLSDSRLNGAGDPLDQPAGWRIVSRYRYGVGVARCAIEMAALGLKVMVSGSMFGGLVTTEAEWLAQTTDNFCGEVVTFDRDRRVCIDAFDHGLVRPESNDIPMAVEHLTNELIGLWDRGWFRVNAA